MVLSVLLAVLAAAANAFSSVLQRKGALEAPPERSSGLRVVVEQLHHKVWFGGFACLVAGFLLQATALSLGSVAMVQPILAAELPITLVLAARIFRQSLGRREWWAVAAMAGGLAAALVSAAPSAGDTDPGGIVELVGCGVAVGALLVITLLGWHLHGSPRAALLGVSTGGLFGVTATLMATVTVRAQSGPAALFGAWQLYAMAALGVTAVVVLQQAYGAGVLAASQPGVTIVDPIVAVVLGVTVFGEQLRLGWLIPVEIAAIGAIIVGALELSRSPVARSQDADPDGDDADDDEAMPDPGEADTRAATT